MSGVIWSLCLQEGHSSTPGSQDLCRLKPRSTLDLFLKVLRGNDRDRGTPPCYPKDHNNRTKQLNRVWVCFLLGNQKDPTKKKHTETSPRFLTPQHPAWCRGNEFVEGVLRSRGNAQNKAVLCGATAAGLWIGEYTTTVWKNGLSFKVDQDLKQDLSTCLLLCLFFFGGAKTKDRLAILFTFLEMRSAKPRGYRHKAPAVRAFHKSLGPCPPECSQNPRACSRVRSFLVVGGQQAVNGSLWQRGWPSTESPELLPSSMC